MENLRIQNLKTITDIQTPETVEDTMEEALCMMTGMVIKETGGGQDILAVIGDQIKAITTTHQSNVITDTVIPSTSTGSLIIGGSTGVQDRADTTKNSTDTTRSTVSTDTENKIRWGVNNTLPEITRIIRGIISTKSKF